MNGMDFQDLLLKWKSPMQKYVHITLHLYEIEEEIRKNIYVLPFSQKETQKA